MMKWRIVAFDHPHSERSVVYRQDLDQEQLIRVIRTAIERGANLMSIRGFKED